MNPTRILFTLILCVSFFMSIAQEATFEFETGKKGDDLKGKEANWASNINIDKANVKAALSFRDRDSAWYFLVDRDFHIESRYAIPGGMIANNYYDGSHEVVLQKQSGNIFTNYLHKANESAVYTEEIDFDLHTSVFKLFLDFNRKEKFITAFEEGGHTYMLTVVKGSNKVRLYLDNETVPKEIALDIPASSGGINFETSLKNVKVIKADKETDLYTAKSKAKLYTTQPGKLYITIDDAFSYTLFFSIDLGNYTSSSALFMKNMFYCNSVDRVDVIQTNSFLFKEKLVQAVLCPTQLLLEVKNIDKDSALYAFHAERDSAIGFASSDLVKREQNSVVRASLFAAKKDPHTVKEKELNTKDFFKAVTRNEFSFVVVKAGNSIVLKMGEAHNLYTSSGGGFYGGGFGGAGGAAMSVPVFYGGYTSKSGQSETYFKTVIKSFETADAIEEDVDTKSDRIDNYEVELKDNKAASMAFDFNGHTYYFYWNKPMEKFLITRVDAE